MFVSMGACALRGVGMFATSVRRGTIVAGCAVALLSACGQRSNADVVQDFYEAPFPSSTGVFEWDNFTTTSGPAPDAQSSGIGSTSFTLNSVAQPFDGPPVALVTSTSNIYTGGTLTDFSVGLTGLETSGVNTTVVLQAAAIGAFSGFELDGLAPTEFLNRGAVEDVEHGSGAAPFDTTFYWAQWQVGSQSDYDLSFANLVTHQSLAGVRVDYFNSASVTDVVAPPVFAVPEPSSGVVLAALLVGGALRRRRSR